MSQVALRGQALVVHHKLARSCNRFRFLSSAGLTAEFFFFFVFTAACAVLKLEPNHFSGWASWVARYIRARRSEEDGDVGEHKMS